jgi:peroxiredoxin
MDAWAESQGVAGDKMLTLMGDPSGAVTRALGMTLDHPGPMGVLGYPRCKRFAMFIDDGVIKLVKVSEAGPAGQEDPAGDDYPEATLAPAIYDEVKKMLGKDEL